MENDRGRHRLGILWNFLGLYEGAQIKSSVRSLKFL
jgi:hypothetical protein